MEQGGRQKLLQDTKVALTGRLASMTHREAAELIQELGGTVVQSPTRSTALLVIGREGLPLGDDGRPTANLLAARKLQATGYPIEILNEDAFLRRLQLVDNHEQVHRRYTIVQLSRILGVPRDRIRAWMRAGLIEPAETVHRLAYFDYHQVTTAKMLYELVSSGLTPARIRESLQRLSGWLPDTDFSLSQLSVLESSGRLLIRLKDGQLAEPSGQLQLDFEPQPRCAVTIESQPRSTEEWFHAAIDYEDSGCLEEAAAAYRAAVRGEPDDPVLHFSLANVLYSIDEREEAATHFRRAVEIDSSYVEAWNNLGNLLAEQGDVDEAVTALRYALHLVPEYADAHFNLASILSNAGRGEEAREHWRAYLRLDPSSPWAEEARKHLAVQAPIS
jgi:tetratricopeptide (TPR) repeat protein